MSELIYIQMPRGYESRRSLVDSSIKILAIREVTEYLQIPEPSIYIKTRKRDIVYARHLIYYFLLRKTKYTLEAIGSFFDRDHTAVIHGVESLADLIDTDEKVRNDIRFLDRRITA